MRPGAGTVSLTHTLEALIAGTGFASAKSIYATGKSQPIVWQ